MRYAMSVPALVAALAAAAPAMADPKEDLCRLRAREQSGFRGDPPQLETRAGGATFRLGGSLGVGVASSDPVPQGLTPPPPAPPFAGAASSERFEARRRQAEQPQRDAYRRIYGDCMQER